MDTRSFVEYKGDKTCYRDASHFPAGGQVSDAVQIINRKVLSDAFELECLYSSFKWSALWFLAFAPILVGAAFTEAACSADNHCIQRGERGTFCFFPDPESRQSSSCDNERLRAALVQHELASNAENASSIAYYAAPQISFLGGAEVHISPRLNADNTTNTIVCTAGIVHTKLFYTTCRFAVRDNDLADSGRTAACGITYAYDQRVVREGCCGPPRSVCPPRPLMINIRAGIASLIAGVLAFMFLCAGRYYRWFDSLRLRLGRRPP